MTYSAVIWDVDGTLLDTREGVVAAADFTVKRLGLPADKVCEVVGFPKIIDAFQTLWKMTEAQAREATEIFRERYKTHDLLKAAVFNGVYDVMKALQKHGVKQAIATNKRQDYATEICVHFKFDEFCCPIYGTDKDGKLTKDKLILACLEYWRAENPAMTATNIAMIGDTDGDKTAAARAGVGFIGVNYGFGFKDVGGYADDVNGILRHIEKSSAPGME